MAATISSSSWRPFILTRVTNLSLHQFSSSNSNQQPPQPLFSFLRRRRPFLLTSSCHVEGDDVVSTQNSTFDRGFTVIANMLRRIQPLDNSVISKGVSDSAKDSMKQTISTMLGLLPSDQFSVTVLLSKFPLHRLLVSSIITGYTLWNAEYRMSLTRNLNMSCGVRGSDCENRLKITEAKGGGEKHEVIEQAVSDLESCSISSPRVFGDLPPQALSYIQQLQSELTSLKEELNVHKQEMMQLENERGNRNNLLEYLRSLDPEMVTEMSRTSLIEVEDIIHQLVENILNRFFMDDASSNFMEPSVEGNIGNGDEFSDTVGTSRDYLAKLLFWCMLLGHHLRGLENRLHLSCVVGLL